MTVTQLEPYCDVAKLEEFFGMGRRWFELRMEEGMPSYVVGKAGGAGKRKFRISECNDWLVSHGHIREEAA